MNSFILILSLSLYLPLSYAWTTSVSFQLYVECLEENTIGIPLTSLPGNPWNFRSVHMYQPATDRNTEYLWQVYPSADIAPVRPARPPARLTYYDPKYLAAGQCTDLPPGICCRAIAPLISNGQFSNLQRNAASAFWGPAVRTLSTPSDGCDGRILNTHYGGSVWAWQDAAFLPRISGASYILCPSSDLEQGWGAVLAGFCARLKRRGAGLLAAAAAPSPPVTWVWPDLITVDGVDYTDDRKGNLLYYNTENRLLNFTGLVLGR